MTQYYGDYCSNSFSPSHAHLWLFIAGILIVAGALEATGAFAKRMKSEMSGTHKERAKIYSFLGIIFFQIIQGVSHPHHSKRHQNVTNNIHQIIFSMLNGKLFSPTRLLTYNDINYGMPSFLTCLESVTFSLLFHWAYSATEFKHRTDRYLPDQKAPRFGTWRAIRDAFDLSDIANAVWVALGYAWVSFVRWWNAPSADRGPIGRLVEAVAGKGKMVVDGRRGKPDVSPFDDNMAVNEPAMPHRARNSAPGRTRTFNGHDAFGTPLAYSAQRTEREPLRKNVSRDSSSSDGSDFRR